MHADCVCVCVCVSVREHNTTLACAVEGTCCLVWAYRCVVALSTTDIAESDLIERLFKCLDLVWCFRSCDSRSQNAISFRHRSTHTYIIFCHFALQRFLVCSACDECQWSRCIAAGLNACATPNSIINHHERSHTHKKEKIVKKFSTHFPHCHTLKTHHQQFKEFDIVFFAGVLPSINVWHMIHKMCMWWLYSCWMRPTYGTQLQQQSRLTNFKRINLQSQ